MSRTAAHLVHDDIFYRDVGVLFGPERRFEFWPAAGMSIEEKINATVRFVLYAGVVLYAATQQPKYVALSWVAAGLLAFLHHHGEGKEGFGLPPGSVSPPGIRHDSSRARPRTRENPFANPLLLDPAAEQPDPVWDEAAAQEANKLFRSKMFMDLTDMSSLHNAERQFMQMPTQDVEAFMRFLAQ
jgi:hypothetical protein